MTSSAPNLNSLARSRADRRLALIIFVTLAVTYGSMFSVNRIATTEGIPFIPYVFWQILFAGLVLCPLCAVRREWPRFNRAGLPNFFALGLLGYVIPFSVLAAAASKAPAGVISLSLTLTPVLVYLIAVLIGMERMKLARMAGIGLSMGGVLIVLLPSSSLPSADMAPWVALGFVAPVCYSGANILAQRLRPAKGSAVALSVGVFTIATVLMLPLMAIDGSWWFFDGGMSVGGWMVFVAAAITALFMVLMYELLRLAGPVFFSTYSYLATLCGIGWAALIFGEVPSVWIWASLALLFSGLFLVNRTQGARTAPKEAG
jgi:drug/metabolite transporter (DMT)-like permease